MMTRVEFPSLDDIACRYGTDKSTLTSLPQAEDGYQSRPSQGHGYTIFYSHYLSPFRQQPIRLLEIGVLDGRSLATWKEYFPQGQIYGLDIDPGCARYTGERTQVFIGSQTDTAFLASIREQVPEGFDIIIDDGSHFVQHVITSFRELFGHLKAGGLYVIEDLHTSAETNWGRIAYNRGMDLQKETTRNDPHALVEFLKGQQTCDDIHELTVHLRKICFIRKSYPNQPKALLQRGDRLEDLEKPSRGKSRSERLVRRTMRLAGFRS